MRIALVAPLWEATPPQTYGGTELVVHLLEKELGRLGHEVTLFAAGGSAVSGSRHARLLPCTEAPLRELGCKAGERTAEWFESELIAKVIKASGEFDIIHNHLGFQFLPYSSLLQAPMVTTLHGVFEPKSIRKLLLKYRDLPFISISDFQRVPCPDLNYIATVYHGIALETFTPKYELDEAPYLAFLGRISPEKGVHEAIKLAREAGYPLKIAGKVDPADEAYYKEVIEPELDDTITFQGEADHEQKVALLSNALATLCAVSWPEPFGLVMVESMACGTPVLALNNGSIPEVIENGVSGYYVNTPEEMEQQLQATIALDRKTVREYAEKRFSASRMTEDYLRLYGHLLNPKERTQRKVVQSDRFGEVSAYGAGASGFSSDRGLFMG